MASFTKNILRKEGRPGTDSAGKWFVVGEDWEAEPPWPKIRVFLYNYNIDGNLPKEEHKKWIKAQLVPFLKATHSHVELQGLASRSGDAKYNEQLSRERVLLLKEFLLDECGLQESQVPGTRLSAIGEKDANPHDDEDAHDRAVKVTIRPGVLSKPIPVPKTKSTPGKPDGIDWIPPVLRHVPPGEGPPPYNHFKIRYCGGGGGNLGKGNGATAHCFDIMNADTGRGARFVLPGISFSTSVGLPITLPGDEWTDLTTAEIMNVEDFNGEHVGYYGQFLGNLGWAELAFDHLHDAGRPRERAKAPIATGATLGAEMSNTRGKLKQVGPARQFRVQKALPP
jgi:hypothetical protein